MLFTSNDVKAINRSSSFDAERAEHTDTQWAEHKVLAGEHGISYITYNKRVIRDNMSPYDAATKPLKVTKNDAVCLDGISDTRHNHCVRLGINYQTIGTYMTRYSIDFGSAVKLRLERMQNE